MSTPEERAGTLYTESLKPEAVAEARKHVLSHTPMELQEPMLTYVDADFPEPVPPEPPDPPVVV